MEKICEQCGKLFFKKPSDSKLYWEKKKFCSRKCFGLFHRKGAFVYCYTCGTKIWREPTILKRNINHYCSAECSMFVGKMNKGNKHTEETKQKIREKRALQVFSKESYVKRGLKMRGENHPMWKGGRKKAEGYIEIYSPNHPNKTKHGYIREHRLIVEKHLGRYLTKKEIVHHINEIKDDNRIENLYLFESLGKHNGYHHKLRHGKIDKITKSNLI